MSKLYEINVKDIHGTERSLSEFKGRYLLIVNLASECGFTKQYAGLESLHQSLKDQGVSVLGFPCNQFGEQEPGSEQEILDGCVVKFGVQFPMFAKVEVNGPDQHELFNFLKSEPEFAEDVKWNFEKFLVSPEGQVLERFASNVTPAELQAKLEGMV